MKTIETDIFDHDNSIDVTHKINTMELHNWITHLKYIDKELKNLIKICSKNSKNNLEESSIVDRFEKKQTENETLLNALVKYSNSRMNIAECEDTLCDMAYISEHESYRRSYLYYIDKYRRLKDIFFDKVHSKYSI